MESHSFATTERTHDTHDNNRLSSESLPEFSQIPSSNPIKKHCYKLKSLDINYIGCMYKVQISVVQGVVNYVRLWHLRYPETFFFK